MEERLNFILKFIEEKYLENYLKRGEIFFNPARYFTDIEDKEGNQGKLDKNEGVMIENVDLERTKYFIQKAESEQKPILLKGLTNVEKKFKAKNVSNIPIACFTLLTPDDFEQKKVGFYTVKREIVEGIKEISNKRKVVMTPFHYFKEKIDDLELREELGLYYSPIAYYEKSTHECKEFIQLDLDNRMVLFTKQKRYETQKEFRISLMEKNIEEGFSINIGSIEELSIVENSIEDLLDLNIKIQEIKSGPERIVQTNN